MQGKDKLGHPG